MPHAVEMPSFLTDDTGPMLSSNRPPLDMPSHIRHSHEKTNGNGRSSSHTSVKGSVGDGSDMYGDAVNGYRHPANGAIHHDENLSSVTNGRQSMSSWDHRSSRNGSTYSVNGGVNGISENDRRSPGPQNGASRHTNGDVNRSSYASTNGTPQGSSADNGSGPTTNGDSGPPRRISIPAPVSANPQSTGPLTYTSPIIPTTSPLLDETPTRAATTSPSGHRFSSPSAYPSPAPSPSSQLQSASPPGQSQLKHRHTLQVPKAGPSRSSRDGDDTVYGTGRFSPTGVVGGVRRGSLNLNRRNTQSIHSNMPHEEVLPDEDALRWAEAVRQKRASKRKKKDEEDDDRVVVGTKVDQNHVNWVTAYNMLTGIRFTVSRTNAKLDRPLTDADFEAKHKFSFDITGNELTPSAKYDFKFKDYAPWVFRHLRAKFKLDPADYLMSLTSKYILSELGSPGKSGSFFYFSRDYKYIIKTIHHAEHKFLRKILKEYYAHVEANPNTLLSQFYGLHRVKIPYGRKIHFVVMNNLFPPHRDIHQTFDLKGSTIGRDFKEEDLEKNPRATLKDLNWLRRNLHLEFGPEKKRLFVEQMRKDVELLRRLKIMDYSMLVGIHDLQKGNQENLRDKTLQVFQPGGDSGADDPDKAPERGVLMRTPSKLESARKARELRQIIKQEKPVPLGQSSSRMLEQMEENTVKKEFTFYSDDGGFRATHEDNSPGEEIFFLSIIDCLTHYGTVKKLENFWKGLSNDKKLISPINPDPYGTRFLEFIEGITKNPEEAAREAELNPVNPTSGLEGVHPNNSLEYSRKRSGSQTQPMHRTNTTNSTIQRNETEALKTEAKDGQSVETERPDPRMITTVRSPSAERTGGMQGQTLPIVEEAGEASSTGGRSERSGEYRPLTPSKEYNGAEYSSRPRTPAKDYPPRRSRESGRMLDGAKQSISRSSLEKDLPPLPPQQ
ncbi:phosphatidylinositol-4-phosphate 5-kinase its3 [Phlyctema vagabunda]|uniref:Phosphatidylinositol-4-phosphate 5-kinase its3 n=1 Tax=Phlyctema vagabunda TaxID=108571 RepID=A0ABR4P8U6_9HELO